MRIAIVIERYDALGGGAERWTAQFADYLVAQQHQVELIAQSFAGAPAQTTCHAINVKHVGRRRLAFAEQAQDLLIKHNCDLVFDMGNGWFADIYMPHHGCRKAGVARNLERMPFPWRSVSSIVQQFLPRYREFDELEARQLSPNQWAGAEQADKRVPTKRIVALSNFVADDMCQHYGIDRDTIHIIHNGIDANKYLPWWEVPSGAETRSANRQAWNATGTVFLFIAHNYRLKGLDELLPAFADHHRRYPADRLLVVGADKRQQYYQQRASQLGLQSAVIFLGHQHNPAGIYQSADVLVQPTWYDPCSLVTLEAWSAGMPVITTKFNGAGELMDASSHGVTISRPDARAELVASLAQARDLASDDEHRKNCRALARANTIERQFERLLNLAQGK